MEPEESSGTSWKLLLNCSDSPAGLSLHCSQIFFTLLHSERPKLYTILAFLSSTGLTELWERWVFEDKSENISYCL